MSSCATCGGTGYLLDQTYGLADIPAGWIPVQRCDACERLDSDEQAATVAAETVRAHGLELFVGDDEDLGDWAICVDFNAVSASDVPA
jgi:hypothetical protein